MTNIEVKALINARRNLVAAQKELARLKKQEFTYRGVSYTR